MNELKDFLEYQAFKMRISSLTMTTLAGSGHPTSALSASDIMSALFFYAMHYDPKNYSNPNNDRFILSKGHASPIFYAAWKEVGVLTEKDLHTYRKMGSVLEGHPTLRFEWTEAATGALGIGLSIGAGMALTAKLDKRPYYTYVLLGDGEISEGAIWEAAEISSYYKLNNLIGIMDVNRLGQTGETIHGHHTQRYADKFDAFGWKTFVIDGHDMQQIMTTLDKARKEEDQPVMIIAKTVKGYGIEAAENKNGFHGKAFKKEELNDILKKHEERFADIANFNPTSYDWKPDIPQASSPEQQGCGAVQMPDPKYTTNQEIPTRKAYGQSLAELGNVCDAVVSLDGEVKNSTFAEIFEKAHPKRFFQCFIAEQNMVSMGVGFQRRGKIPFISTFGAFFSRAYDQVRMAAIGTCPLRLVGSHAGVSIGQDGPSQMGLEDLAIMRALPGSIVMYPCDAVSTYKCVEQMANFNDGISYMRTTRMATSVIYDRNEKFKIGGCKVLRKSDADVACVVAAGVTLFEALKAHDQLKQEGISISVIDLYSIKPVDRQTLIKQGEGSNNRIITVEDHYLPGGLGQAVVFALRNTCIEIDCLAVMKLPRSGKPEELLAWAGIDANAIVKAVKKKK